jgi:hypothetical protein
MLGIGTAGCRTWAATAIHLEARRPVLSALVVIMPNLDVDTKLTRPSIFSLRGGSSRFLALYGSAGLVPVSALLKDMLDLGVKVTDLLGGLWIVFLEESRLVAKALQRLRDSAE